jgi:ATP-dependent DNA helicase RecG
MTNDRLRKIFAEGNPDFLSQPAVGGLSDQEVVSKLDTQIYYDLLQSPFPSQRDEVLERFTKEGLIRRSEGRYEITNLGAILFAKNLQEFDRVSSKAPRVLVYESRDRLSARSDLIGSKGYAIAFESLINYIHSQTSLNEEIGRALRRDVRMYPAISIRELVANTLIHQDFNEIGSSVRIEIYPDRIEFTSPGTPFISTDRFIDEDQARNERLADPQPPPSPL